MEEWHKGRFTAYLTQAISIHFYWGIILILLYLWDIITTEENSQTDQILSGEMKLSSHP